MLEIIAGLLILAGLGALGFYLYRNYVGGGLPTVGFFGGSRERRIGVMETANIDGRRKLLLIYRDGVEHLVMTGGPIDVVIEQGIIPQRRAQPMQPMERPVPMAPVDGGDPSAQQGFGGRIRARITQPTLDSQ